MKNLVLLIIIFTCFACNSTENPITSANPHEAFIKQYFEYFNQHDWQKMASMYADTADFKDPSLGQSIVKQTHEQTIKKYSELNQAFPDLKDSVTNIYPAGEKHIVVEFISKGTAPDKSAFVLPICTIFTIENGVITKDFTYYDNF